MNTEIPFFILSAETDIHSTNENAYRTGMLNRQVRKLGLATAKCRGVYKGRAEASILVIDETPHNDDCFNAVLRLARTYAQKSILAVDANRNANLVYTDERRGSESLGRFISVPKEVAKAQESYTERAGRYYVCI